MLEEAFKNKEIETAEFLPSEEVIKAIRDSLENTITLKQLIALQNQLIHRPTWLEGYYFAARMLYKLNRTEIAQKIEEDLYYYIHKQQECIRFTLSSGRKLISVQMETWVKKKVLTLCGEGERDVEYKKVYQEALALKAEENEQNALEFLEKHYKDAPSAEAQFKWRLLFVDFALEIGDKRLALALLLELEKQIEVYKLDIWQPQLAIQTYETLLKPMMTQELGEQNQERIYKKLSILDIQKVIKI
jgi:hypothetical protein